MRGVSSPENIKGVEKLRDDAEVRDVGRKGRTADVLSVPSHSS